MWWAAEIPVGSRRVSAAQGSAYRPEERPLRSRQLKDRPRSSERRSRCSAGLHFPRGERVVGSRDIQAPDGQRDQSWV